MPSLTRVNGLEDEHFRCHEASFLDKFCVEVAGTGLSLVFVGGDHQAA